MSRYAATFARLKKERRIGICAFAVLGDPTPQECLQRIDEYLKATPDFLELGIPFSDPTADGPTIQAADERAIKAGTTPHVALDLIKKIRIRANKAGQKNLPIGILTYANIIHAYGITKFYRELAAAGADSILIADVPLEESAPFVAAARHHNLHQIFIISEQTSRTRLSAIEKAGSGFLYVVSTPGVTGVRDALSATSLSFIRRFKKQAHLPIMVGFGISKNAHIEQLKATGADAAIIGSALVQTQTASLFHTMQNLMADVQMLYSGSL